MRGLLKIAFAVGVAALAARLINRLLSASDDAGAGQEIGGAGAHPAPRSASPQAADGPAPASVGPTRDELYEEAARLDVKGRSKMNKRQLQEAVEAARTGGDT